MLVISHLNTLNPETSELGQELETKTLLQVEV
jgi:hypothetical protein